MPDPRVFVPYSAPGAPYPSQAIFWLGKVDPTSNYADVRLIYDDSNLVITLHIIDRSLWYDTTPSAADLTAWDAVSLFIDQQGAPSAAPGETSLRFTGQFWVSETDLTRQTVHRGNGQDWIPQSFPVRIGSTWRGSGPNDSADDKGWEIHFIVPFSSLGLPGPPVSGTPWSLAVIVHDRDDVTGTPIPDVRWPETMNPNIPSSWGQLVFGPPHYDIPSGQPSTVVTIREGVNGAHVMDAHVGGHTTCGEGIDHWSEWGEKNYAGYDQINIQNQWDVADYPCFSKFYITFPMDGLPPDKTVISATLTMYLFGNAGYEPGQAQPSAIQALTVADGWTETTVNWNNAPPAVQNVALTWVYPVDFYAEWPGVPYSWDVASAVAEAYSSGEPLRLALYSADGEMHSGKYFWSSDAGEAGRPKLDVFLGDPSLTLRVYLPIITRQALH